MLLSLFCGAGGLDLGFERAGFDIALAFDKKADSVMSYNHNRPGRRVARCEDVTTLTLEHLDRFYGGTFQPEGVVGGPPCQSFSKANTFVEDSDPRHTLPLVYAKLLARLNRRSPVKFFVMENVPGLCSDRHAHRLKQFKAALRSAGFNVFEALLDARDYNTPQNRERLFLIGLNAKLFKRVRWEKPVPTTGPGGDVTVRSAIGGLIEPVFFERNADPERFPLHRNHWCMRPKSAKFTRAGALVPGNGNNRSFKTLAWDAPSPTVAYGNREVHIHPNCHRRLSVYEAMRLQGFPHEYVLLGNLSSQIAQVSEAVPPAMAHAVAFSLRAVLDRSISVAPATEK